MPKNSGRPQQLILLVKSSPFLKHNFIFFTGSLAVAALNYLLYPVLSRLMKPADFGEVQTLTALFTQATIFLTILSYVTIHVTVNIENQEERTRTLLGLERIAMIGGYTLLIIALLGVEQLRSFLHFEEVWPFVALIGAMAVSVPLAFRMAYLRGRKQFLKAVATDGIGSLVKLILAPIFVLLGWRSFGAIFGLAVSQVISLLLGIAWARQLGMHGFAITSEAKRLSALKPQLRHALAVLQASGCIVLLQTLDILAIKHYFSPNQAGLYAGITIVASIVFFLMAPITAVMVTSVSLQQSASKNRLQLKGSIALMLALGSSALAIMALVPELIIKLLVGSKYLTYAQYLPRVGLIMLLLATSSAIMMYHVALKQYLIAALAGSTVLLTYGLIYTNHATILAVVNDLLVGSVVLLIINIIQSFLLHRRTREAVHG